MSRGTWTVKTKLTKNPPPRRRGLETIGAIDLHFHGAFGIDLMSASPNQLNELSAALWQSGLAGFCPTTVTTPIPNLAQTVKKLGHWIRSNRFPGAKPLGIHLEGPWIHPEMNGAHPSRLVRKLKRSELEKLWEASQETLKIITLAPERLSFSELQWLITWCKERNILLSAGHSRATFEEAKKCFELGIQGVTHAWNALAYHHREPGVLGAALGNPQIYLELIVDQVHLSRPWIRWTRQLHPSQSICMISDCVAPAGSRPNQQASDWTTLGGLAVRLIDGASRSKNGQLAGGGQLLTESYSRWVLAEALDLGLTVQKVLKDSVHQLTLVPARVLGIKPGFFKDRKVIWNYDRQEGLSVIPIDSQATPR